MEYAPGWRAMTSEQLAAILADHVRWLVGAGGERANLGGANLALANLARCNLARANLARANLDSANLNSANLGGANLNSANLYSANLGGAKINNDKIAIGILRRATRSDGWEFFLWHCQDGFYVKAGCRFFDVAQARQHWIATRAETPLGDETQDILNMFEKAIERQVQS
jgi:hypothetical protein